MRKHPGLSLFSTCAALLAGSLLTSAASAQRSVSFAEPSSHAALFSVADYSTSASSFSHTDAFAAAEPSSLNDKLFAGGISRPPVAYTPGMRPFSAVAVALKVGSGGIGFDVATPLMQRLNLRSGASFFSYNTSLTQDGLNIAGAIKFQNASTSVDIFPFNGSFRISPGITFRNNNALNAAITVPGGQSFSLGDSDYTSDPLDPIHGTAAFAFGSSNFAPRLTMGFGNMLPRNGSRFSFPVEVGFEYISQPTVRLNFAGSACGSQVQSDGSVGAGCGSVNPSDVAQEQSQLQSDLSPLRFYPIVSFGVSYRIGHINRAH
jgi:hypothetical protein